MGHYTLEILVDEVYTGESKKKKIINMYLNIHSAPKVNVTAENSDFQFFIAEETSKLMCEVQGYPIDQNSLNWMFK